MTDTLAANAIRPAPDKIIVPRKHGELLIEPPLATLAGATNSDSFSGKNFLGDNITNLRKQAREYLEKALAEWAQTIGVETPKLAGPLIFTGHQVEFYHAGVWAKVLAADELARRTSGTAIDLLVDHDTVDQRGFDIPLQIDQTWKRESVDYAAATNIPADALSAPTRDAFEKWDAAIGRFPIAHTDALAEILTALGQLQTIPPHAVWLSRARSRFESSMNLAVHHVPTSLICKGGLWERFVHAWRQNAPAWTAIYNRCLEAYRTRQGIKNPQQPMPNLSRKDAQIELPFWAYRPGEPRRRVSVNSGTLFADHEKITSEFVIRPRALTLTMFVRLFLADIFIHGIGGALYDQITDGIMQELFSIIPPYGCVSAAWLLPLGQAAENNADLSGLRWQRHHVVHNPQQAIDPFTALKTDIAELITQRRNLVAQIAASLSAHRSEKNEKHTRRQWFNELHRINASLHARCPAPLQKIERQIADLLAAQAQNKVLLWREYFFPLHTRQSLESLIQKIRIPP